MRQRQHMKQQHTIKQQQQHEQKHELYRVTSNVGQDISVAKSIMRMEKTGW